MLALTESALARIAIAGSNCPPPAMMVAAPRLLPARGFTIAQMVELVRAGLASATAERVVAGGRMMEVARVKITEAGGALARSMRTDLLH
jgi:hypothetical protein